MPMTITPKRATEAAKTQPIPGSSSALVLPHLNHLHQDFDGATFRKRKEEPLESPGATIQGPARIAAVDHAIVDRVYRALRASGYGQFLKLKVYSDHGRVTLQGCVPTYYLKQVAQSILESIDAIRDIDNDLRVWNGK